MIAGYSYKRPWKVYYKVYDLLSNNFIVPSESLLDTIKCYWSDVNRTRRFVGSSYGVIYIINLLFIQS